ncbi:hypothetical protein McanMca71_001021 [Microsporum canis]
MFVTLRYGSDEGDEIRCVESTSKPPYEASPDPHFACNACRAKKLKCDGDKTGCQRCSSAGTECSYRAEKPSVKKRKHHLLSSSSKPPALPAAQSPRQSRPQPSPENERPAESTAFLQDAPSVGESIALWESGDQERPPPSRKSAGFHPSSGWRYPFELCAKTGFCGRSHDRQGDDMLSHTLQRHPVVALAEDAGMSLSTHEQPLEDDFTISTQGSPPFPGPLNPISRTISSPGTSSRGSGKTSHCASIDSSIGHNSSTNSCQCTRSALKILEVVSSHFKPAEGLYSVEQALYTLKRNIGQCQSIVQCSASGGDPGLKLLVIVLCEKMIAIFEGISAGWDRQLQAVARMKQTRPGGAAAAASAVNSAATQEDTWVSQYRRVTIGGYQIDTIEERHTVFGMLIQLQLKRLSDTIAKLSKNAMTENLESHLAILMPMNQKVKNLKAALDRTTLSHS